MPLFFCSRSGDRKFLVLSLAQKEVTHDRENLRVVIGGCSHHASHAAKVGGIETVVGTLYSVKSCRGIERDSLLGIGDRHHDIARSV